MVYILGKKIKPEYLNFNQTRHIILALLCIHHFPLYWLNNPYTYIYIKPVLYVYGDMLTVGGGKRECKESAAGVSSFDINCNHIVIYYASFHRNEVIPVNKYGFVIGVR